jgi:uncharacterized membrane protein (DUF4010 family)
MDPALGEVFGRLGIALGLGLLVGLQRESADSQLAGLRTVPLVTLLGTVCGLLVPLAGGWAVAAGLLGVAAATAMGNLARIRGGSSDPGMTTEVALLLMFAVGAYLAHGHRAAAVAVGGLVAVLLHFKAELHGIAGRLGSGELRAVMQFVLLALVILPVLPDDEYGPYAVFNPREMWLMVVLVVGLSLAGWIALRFFGEKVGVIAGGLLGGLVSSTATTVSWAKRSRGEGSASRAAAVVIGIASTVVFARVLVEVSAVARPFLRAAAPPVLTLMACMAVACLWLWMRTRRDAPDSAVHGGEPVDLKAAFAFAALYVVVLLAVAWAQDRLGTRGLYVVSVISGLTDVDAITLSVSRLVASGQVDPSQGWRLIVVALLSNLVFKGGMAMTLGDARLRRWIAILFGSQLLAGVAVLLLWPD